jgi:hypothetical protein
LEHKQADVEPAAGCVIHLAARESVFAHGQHPHGDRIHDCLGGVVVTHLVGTTTI